MLGFGHMPKAALDRVAQSGKRHLLRFDGYGAGFDLRQVENIADEVHEIGAGGVNIFRKLHLLGFQIALGIIGQLLRQNQHAVERRAQLVRHVSEKLGLVLGGERQLSGLFLYGVAGLLDFSVLAFDLGVLLGQLLGFVAQLLVGLLQLFLLGLQLGRQLLRLLQQTLCSHGRFDAVEHDADTFSQLREKGQMRGSKLRQGRQLHNGLGVSLEEHG
jgi:hypothetical protein